MFGDFGLHHRHGWKLELCMYVWYSLQQQVNERDHCYLNWECNCYPLLVGSITQQQAKLLVSHSSNAWFAQASSSNSLSQFAQLDWLAADDPWPYALENTSLLLISSYCAELLILTFNVPTSGQSSMYKAKPRKMLYHPRRTADVPNTQCITYHTALKLWPLHMCVNQGGSELVRAISAAGLMHPSGCYNTRGCTHIAS